MGLLVDPSTSTNRETSARGMHRLKKVQEHMQKTEITEFQMQPKQGVYCCWILLVGTSITQLFCSCPDFLCVGPILRPLMPYCLLVVSLSHPAPALCLWPLSLSVHRLCLCLSCTSSACLYVRQHLSLSAYFRK